MTTAAESFFDLLGDRGTIECVSVPGSEAGRGLTPDLEQILVPLFEQYHARILRYVLTFGLPFQEAEDVVQETFFFLFRHLERGRSRENLTGWLFRVAHNLACKGYRSAQPTVRDHEAALAQHASPEPDPEAHFALHQRSVTLRAVYEALPEQEQRCLQLRAEGLTYREIAKVLRVSLGTVSTLLSRSLGKMARAADEP